MPFGLCFRNVDTDVCYMFFAPSPHDDDLASSHGATVGAIMTVIVVSVLLLIGMLFWR